MFKRILIANRGEIAVRVIRACRELGIESVAVYSEADRAALHVREADYAVPVGPAPAARELSQHRKDSRRRETHRRRRDSSRLRLFLRERRVSRARSQKAGITFIGPPPDAIEQMGDKVEARKLMTAAGVPVVPGSPGTLETEEEVARDREKDRLPDHGQSGGGRRRQGPAPGRERQGPRVDRAHGRERGQVVIRRRPLLCREICQAAAPYRGAGVRRRARQHRPHVRARMLDSAAPSEGRRGIAVAVHHARDARQDGRGRGARRESGELRRRRHDRIPGRRGPQLLLPRNEHPHPGRASGDRAGDRHRSGSRANRSCRRREAAVQAKGSGAARMGDRVPHLCGRSDGRLRAGAGKNRDAEISRRSGRAQRRGRLRGRRSAGVLRSDDLEAGGVGRGSRCRRSTGCAARSANS